MKNKSHLTGILAGLLVAALSVSAQTTNVVEQWDFTGNSLVGLNGTNVTFVNSGSNADQTGGARNNTYTVNRSSGFSGDVITGLNISSSNANTLTVSFTIASWDLTRSGSNGYWGIRLQQANATNVAEFRFSADTTGGTKTVLANAFGQITDSGLTPRTSAIGGLVSSNHSSASPLTVSLTLNFVSSTYTLASTSWYNQYVAQGAGTITGLSNAVIDKFGWTWQGINDTPTTAAPNGDFIELDQVRIATVFQETATAVPLTSNEVAQIETDLGITLSQMEKTQLAEIVKPGGTPPAWRAAAEARIEANRKADLDIQVVDANGIPLQGAQVAVTLRKSAFKFGGVVQAQDLTDADGDLAAAGSTTNDWQRLAKALFNALGTANNFKPKLTSLHQYLPRFLSWAATNTLDVRGHTLMWPGNGSGADLDDTNAVSGTDYGNHLSVGWPESLNSVPGYGSVVSYNVLGAVNAYKANRTQAKKNALKADVDAEIKQWAGLWNVYEWDVINETMNNLLLMDILGYDQMAEWFKIAQTNAVNPNCKLLINDYKIISAPADPAAPSWLNYTNRRAIYMSRINQIIADGGRIDRIGFQNRYNTGMPDPATTYTRLEEWGNTYGREMVGTEFEVVDDTNTAWYPYDFTEYERAKITEETMTAYFSHPLTTGLNAWTFMSTNNDERALTYYTGTVKLNGLVWYYLHRIRYHTQATNTTDASGLMSLRGFKGDYDIVVNYNGTNYPATYKLMSNSTTVVVLNNVVISGYDTWVLGYPTLGSATNRADNPDNDALNNFGEYVLGGNPTNASDVGIAPSYRLVQDGGINYLECIHVQRNNDPLLSYQLETKTNLASGTWMSGGYLITGTNTNYGLVDFDAVTNRFPTAAKDRLFIRLRVQ